MIKKFNIITNSENKKILISNFLSLSVLRGFQFLIPLITLPYLIRTIGMENFGLVNFALSLGLYFGAIIQFGFSITATREIARHRDNHIKLEQIYSATLTASILLAFICGVLFTLVVLAIDKFNSHFNLYIFTLAFIVFQSLFPIWFFQGMEKMKYITFLSMGTSVMFLISLLTFIKQEEDFILVPLLNAMTVLITFIIAITLINKQFKINFIRPRMQEIKSIYQNGHHAFVSQLAPNLFNNSAVFLVGIFTNNTLVGVYAGATKIIDAMISLAYILSNSFFPFLSRNLEKHKVFQRIMLASAFVLTISTFVMAKFFATLLFSIDSIEVSRYIQGLSICIFLKFTSMTYGTNFLMLIGKEGIVKNISLYTSIVFFGVALFIIPLWGVWGAIVTLVGGRLTMAIILFSFYLKFKQHWQVK